MSKVGKKPVDIPAGTTPQVVGQKVSIKGPKGELHFIVHDDVAVKLEGNQISVDPRTETKKARALWGTSRACINNIVVGVTKGFEKKLEITGVGYKASVEGKNLNLSLGYSHPVLYPIPADLDPLWKMRLLVRETFVDPTSNLYKAAFARMFFPAAFVLYSEEEYTLDVEVLITRRDELIGSYAARGPIRYRYQLNAPELEREAEGLELILSRVNEELFAKISADAERILAEDRARAGK